MNKTNNKLSIFPIISKIFIISLLFATFSCSTSDNGSNGHYSGNGVSFNYPTTWEKVSSSSQYAVASLVNTENSSVTLDIEKNDLPAGYTLDNINAELINTLSPLMVLNTSSTTVSGVSARDTLFYTQDYEIRFVCLIKNKTIYAILCSSPPDIFAEQEGFSMVIDSFKIN